MTIEKLEIDEDTCVPHPRRRLLSRRDFLCNLTIILAGGLAAACAAPPEAQLDRAGPRATPPAALPSPQPPTTVTPAPDAQRLSEFLALSTLLTGVADLDLVLGRVYLQSLEANTQFEVTVAELLQLSGFDAGSAPATLEELTATDIFAHPATRSLADKITEYWYTGVYDTPEGGQAVATFVDALAWATLVFTKPATICGAPGFWAVAPETVWDFQ